ncbi:MAG TPA: hypothetical protein VFW77_05310 [Candidatus Saccharimonadales bacterium]|nr:hypothetical protein [Candidatus Saccharimonadales bacterium]
MSFETLIAHRRISSYSVVEDARAAIDDVLGEGAVDFSAGAQSGEMHLLSEEELVQMQRITGSLSGLSVRQIVQTAAALMPSTFGECTNVVPSIAFRHLEDGGRSLILSLSRKDRFSEERRAFTDAIERVALADIPWPRAVFGIDLGMIDEGAEINPGDIKEITGRLPDKARLFQGETALASLPLAA